MKWMGKADSPLNMRLRMSLQQWRWLLQFLRACNNQTNKMNGDHIYACRCSAVRSCRRGGMRIILPISTGGAAEN